MRDIERLERLAKLRESGAISESEYQAQKSAALNNKGFLGSQRGLMIIGGCIIALIVASAAVLLGRNVVSSEPLSQSTPKASSTSIEVAQPIDQECQGRFITTSTESKDNKAQIDFIANDVNVRFSDFGTDQARRQSRDRNVYVSKDGSWRFRCSGDAITATKTTTGQFAGVMTFAGKRSDDEMKIEEDDTAAELADQFEAIIDDAWSGGYSRKADSNGAAASLTINPAGGSDMRHFSLSVGGPQCDGEIEFTTQVNASRATTMGPDQKMAEMCHLELSKSKNGIIVKEVDCGTYHGVYCDFGGNYARR